MLEAFNFVILSNAGVIVIMVFWFSTKYVCLYKVIGVIYFQFDHDWHFMWNFRTVTTNIYDEHYLSCYYLLQVYNNLGNSINIEK